MADVTISNPTVQIDLSNTESTTVPPGEQFKVSLIGEPGGGRIEINGKAAVQGNNADTTAIVRTDLFGGDTVQTINGPAVIRGYRVD